MFVTCTVIIAVACLMTASTLSVGIAFAQPVQPPFSQPGPPFSNQQLQVRIVDGHDINMNPDTSGNSRADCDLGEVATGGGFVASSGDGSISINSSTAAGGIFGWAVGGHNSGDDIQFLRAIAVCAKLPNAP